VRSHITKKSRVKIITIKTILIITVIIMIIIIHFSNFAAVYS